MADATPSIAPDSSRGSRRVLEPIERVSEVLFGLIMVMTFTGSLSVATAGREDTREMLIGAIGCNIAWGIVDAIFYLMNSLTERARGRMALRAVRAATEARAAHREIADALPPVVASVLTHEELESLRQRLAKVDQPPPARFLTVNELRGALGVFLLVFLSTLPVVLPFVFMSEARPALRVSNAIAIVMLYICGHSLGAYAGMRPWLVGLVMVFVGAVLAVMTLALGG